MKTTPLYLDSARSPHERAAALLAEMSAEEKLAQLGCIFPLGEDYTDLDKYAATMPLGTGEVSTLEMRRIATLDEAATWQRGMQQRVMANSPHHIPAIFHMEGLCGAFIQQATSFPDGLARGAGWDPALEEQIARTVARQEAACGVTHILAPVLDISRDARMGRQGESYGEDPTLAAALGAAYTRGVQSTTVDGRTPQSVAKHFAAFQNSLGGIHGAQSDTPPRLLEEVYTKPFQAAITESGLQGIMPCYNVLDGEPVSVSRRMLTSLLRERMGFQGLCISDYGAISNAHEVQRIGETMAEAGRRALEAGMDIEMPRPVGYGPELLDLLRRTEGGLALLDKTVLAVLEEKFRMGLFEHPFAMEGKALHNAFAAEPGRALSLQAARQSLVLLKNNGVLPLKRPAKVAVIGPHAACARKFFGGYTHLCMMESVYAVASSIAGVEGNGGTVTPPAGLRFVPGTKIQSDEGAQFDEILARQKPDCPSLLEELQFRLPGAEVLYAYGYPIAGADESGFAAALDAVRQADVAILTLGGKHGTCSIASMGEGVDASDINLPPCQDTFLRAAAKLCTPLIGVHFDGRPVSSDAADQCLDALLEAWSPAESGARAVVDALLGDYNPGGKLPVTVAYHAGQLPVFYNHLNGSSWHGQESIGFLNYVDLPHTPRYCFGYGLSYTTFAYSALTLSAQEVGPDCPVKISCTVQNTGAVAGDEVVQLYLRDRFASMTRPVKELAGFCRVPLIPGEARRITFIVYPSQLAYLDCKMRWFIEAGDIDIEIGASSEDIRLQGTFRITQNAFIDGAHRAFYAEPSVESTAPAAPKEENHEQN